MRRLLNQARFVVLVPVAGLVTTTLITIVWSIAKTVKLIDQLLGGGWRTDESLVALLKVIDTHLLAIVQLIVAIGLYELFIGALEVPKWLKARSLDDLKKSIVDVLIVFIGVKGIEGLLAVDKPVDALAFSGAAGVLIAALSLFRIRSSPKSSEQ